MYHPLSLSNEKGIEHFYFFSSIACNLTIASIRLRQEHYYLATIQRAKLKGGFMSH